MSNYQSAAEYLEGKVLDAKLSVNGEIVSTPWRVIRKIEQQPGATGGSHSFGYEVEDDAKRRGFCKAYDISWAIWTGNSLVMEATIKAYNFEKEVLTRCNGSSRVIGLLGDGWITVPEVVQYPRVPFVILEWADGGDLRTSIDFAAKVDWAFRLRCLHELAVGLEQLHTRGVIHQDIKPSNIVHLPTEGHKISDMGSAGTRTAMNPMEEIGESIVDRGYLPPEAEFWTTSPDWESRIRADLHMLGGLVYFLATGITLRIATHVKLPKALRPGEWQGDYTGVLAAYEEAFSNVLFDLESTLPLTIRSEIVASVKELSHPDPSRRGHPTNLRPESHLVWHSLERYIGRFNTLASRAEAGLIRE